MIGCEGNVKYVSKFYQDSDFLRMSRPVLFHLSSFLPIVSSRFSISFNSSLVVGEVCMTEVVEDWLGLSLRIDNLWEIEETKSFDASSQGGGSQ